MLRYRSASLCFNQRLKKTWSFQKYLVVLKETLDLAGLIIRQRVCLKTDRNDAIKEKRETVG